MKYTLFGFSQEKAIELGLDVGDLMILRWFVDFNDTNGMTSKIIDGETYYWINYEKISEEYPIQSWNKDTVYKRLKKMAKLGILDRKTVKQCGTWSYYKKGNKYLQLISSNSSNVNHSEKNPKGSEKNPEQNIPLPYPSTNTPLLKEIYKEKDLKEEFEKLWSMYPRKEGKENAKTKYIKARKAGTTYEEVEKGIENYNTYIRVTRRESKYIKAGSTWFNQHCWEDDYGLKKASWADEHKPSYDLDEYEKHSIFDDSPDLPF